MSKTRTFGLTAVAVLALAATAFATLPATAEEEPTGFQVALQITSTLPRVEGVITVTDATGAPVSPAILDITSTLDLAPEAPAARSISVTNADGDAAFFFGYASTGSAPGDHTLTVVVSKDGVDQTMTFAYSVPDL